MSNQMTHNTSSTGILSRRAILLVALLTIVSRQACAFVAVTGPLRHIQSSHGSTSSSTSLSAVPALVKRAKKEALKQYVTQGVPEEVMTVYKSMIESVKNNDDSAAKSADTLIPMGPLQEAITRRKGTLTVIAEFRRKREARDKPTATNEGDATDTKAATTDSAASLSNIISDNTSLNLDPEVLSPMFRASGVAGIAVLADERVGGCSLADLQTIVVEQSRAQYQVPGPVIVINSDTIIDELQIAQSKVAGVGAVLVSLTMNGNDQTERLLQCCRAVDLECIVAVETSQEAQQAVDMGAAMISVTNVDGSDAKASVICDLHIPEHRRVSTIANIRAYNDNQWLEVEEAWAIRDKGFNCAWVGDALYKSGTDISETPAAIIKAMKSKSSVKWASPKVYTGKGEGAREYLGDIMM